MLIALKASPLNDTQDYDLVVEKGGVLKSV